MLMESGVLRYVTTSTAAASSSQQRKVLVLAYFRSGSTLTGQLFNFNPSAFYWFEPLAAVSRRWGWDGRAMPTRNWYHYDNGTQKYDDYRRFHRAMLGTRGY